MLKYISGVNYAAMQLLRQSLNINQFIVAVPGTALHRVVEACIGINTSNIDYGGSLFDDDAHLGLMETSTIVSDSQHGNPIVLEQDLEADEPYRVCISEHSQKYISMVSDLAGVIGRNMELAKQASSMIGAAFDDINNKFGKVDLVVPIEVLPVAGTGAIVNDDKLYRYAKDNCGNNPDLDAKKAQIPQVYPSFGTLDDFPIADIIKTNVASLDEQLKEWALNGGALVVYETYKTLFISGSNLFPANNEGYVNIDGSMIDWWSESNSPLDRHLALLLLASNIEALELTVSIKLSLAAIEHSLKELRQFAAANIVKHLDTVKQNRKNGKLVYQYPRAININDDWNKETRKIIVDGELFKDFLGKGGTTEVIMGSYVSNHWYNVEDLLSRNDELLAEWTRGAAFLHRERQQSELSRLLRTLRDRFLADFNALPDDHRALIDTNHINCELDRVNKHLTSENMPRLYDILRELYTGVFYHGTLVQDLLRRIDEVKASTASDDVSVMEIAIIEFVTQYLVSEQCTSIKAK